MNLKNPYFKNATAIGIISIASFFVSPQYVNPYAVWIFYASFLWFMRNANWKWMLFSIPFLIAANLKSQLDVLPMPAQIAAVIISVGTITGYLPFLVDRKLYHSLPRWIRIFSFPVLMSVYQIMIDQGPQGTWGNPVYTQYTFLPLMQIASITGIYAINFIIYWSAAYANEWLVTRKDKTASPLMIHLMPVTFLLVIGFGLIRMNTSDKITNEVKVAGIALDNKNIVAEMYQAAFDKEISIPDHLTNADPLILEAQKGMLKFLENPKDPTFSSVYEAMDNNFNKYTESTIEAAANGAKIIAWSEAAILNITGREEPYQNKIASLADSLDLFLLFPTAVIDPEKVGVADYFIENKVLTYGPEGDLLNTYHKNVPVEGVEPVLPGDGNIPVIDSPYGGLSPIICYDADHPQLIKQISTQETDLLIVPTGDWYAISPYHTYMAGTRCIENGVSMLKATSHGLSATVDPYGRLTSSYSFFDSEDGGTLEASMDIYSVNTFYTYGERIFITAIQLSFLGMIIYLLIQFLFRRYRFYFNRKARTLVDA